MGMNMVVYQLVNEYKRIPEVKAITLAGSGANGRRQLFGYRYRYYSIKRN